MILIISIKSAKIVNVKTKNNNVNIQITHKLNAENQILMIYLNLNNQSNKLKNYLKNQKIKEKFNKKLIKLLIMILIQILLFKS